jgi:hypothetical protein
MQRLTICYPRETSAACTESQLPLSAINSRNVWKCRGTVPYNRLIRTGTSTHWGNAMAVDTYKAKRTNPRFSFFADAELSLRDGTGVRGQIAELSSRGCYIDTLEPIPVRTKLRLRICDGITTCELHGKVLYMHSGGGFGIFGMGVLFEEMGPEQHSTIDAWLRKLGGRPRKDLGKNSFS